jgi:hypothetical protein
VNGSDFAYIAAESVAGLILSAACVGLVLGAYAVGVCLARAAGLA